MEASLRIFETRPNAHGELTRDTIPIAGRIAYIEQSALHRRDM